ncbi:MAG: signal peptidase I [Lachnospiraceae bacterium]|nr:signal peptidase I [Lachnospiraceae bacterium]
MEYDFDRQERQKKRARLFLKIIIWVLSVAAVIAAAFFTVKFSVERTNMVGDSMEPTLSHNDTIVINKLSYLRSGPDRFDVIVYRGGASDHDFYSIKRVIGLPGETVQIMGGYVYINGEKLEEPEVTDPILIAGLASGKMKLDDDEYFVLGDNRNSSEDSRFANFGNVTIDSIVGRAWIRTNNFGFVSKFNLKENEPEENEEGDGEAAGDDTGKDKD